MSIREKRGSKRTNLSLIVVLFFINAAVLSHAGLVGQWLTPDPVTFNGVAGDVIDTGVVGPTGTGARTITAWVNLASGTTNASIVSQGDSWLNGVGKRFTLKTNNDDNRLRVEIGGGYAVSTSNVADGTWHHVAVTSAAGNTSCSNLTFYIDGELDVVASSLAGTINTEAASLLIGGIIPRNEMFLTGSLMDVRVYDEVLDQAAIAAMIPEPATMLLLGLGSLVTLRKRK